MDQHKRKPCDKPQPYTHKPCKKVNNDTPATSSKPVQKGGQENLTLYDWLTVFQFMDNHPDLGHANIVTQFRTL
jgi:hypothetical protein